MSNYSPTDRTETETAGSKLRDRFFSAVAAVRQSFTLFVAVVGFVLVAIGATPLVNGVLAGMFGIWGVTALVCAGLLFVGVTLLKIFDN